jgi:GTP-binding protein
VRFGEHEFVLADIPGLIEGAAEGRGLGHTFLRHVERARVLIILVDLASTEERSPEEQEKILLSELERYRPDLLERPRLVVGSKSDVATVEFSGMKLSAVTRSGLDSFLGALSTIIESARSNDLIAESYAVLRPREEGFSVEREDDGAFRVSGRSAERVVAMADMTNLEAIAYVQERFRRMGVERALVRAGVRDGDTVRIGSIELEYFQGFS